MKILAINGSSKGGSSNTWKLTRRFLPLYYYTVPGGSMPRAASGRRQRRS